MLKHTDQANNRIADGLKKYSRIVTRARERGMNERDTADIVKAMLGDMLGFDPFFDVTAEVSVRGPLADYAVLHERRMQFLLNVKSIGITPNATHLLRMSGSSTPPYADWVVLTNGDVWSVYRLGVGQDRHPELVFRVSLLDNRPVEEKAHLFYLISKEGILNQSLRLYWEQMRVLNPNRVASLLLSSEVLAILRREVQRTTGYRVDRHTLQEILTRDVLRPSTLGGFSGEDENQPALPQSFAYVRNPHDPATWRLRYRNSDGTPNADWLTMAVADLSGDPRTVGIPADDIPLVKERLRQAYLELGVSTAELPASLHI